MIYRVIVLPSAQREIQKLSREIQARIVARITQLENDPRPHGAIKLVAFDEYRIRVGNYRIIYTIDDTIVTVTVVHVGHRRDVYR